MFIGNSLIIFVMNRKPFKQLPISVVLISLAGSDTLVSLMLPFNKVFVRKMVGCDIRAISAVACKMFYWAWRTFKVTETLKMSVFVPLQMTDNQHVPWW